MEAYPPCRKRSNLPAGRRPRTRGVGTDSLDSLASRMLTHPYLSTIIGSGVKECKGNVGLISALLADIIVHVNYLTNSDAGSIVPHRKEKGKGGGPQNPPGGICDAGPK